MTEAATSDLLGRLEGRGDPAVAAWWERYLRGVIRFRGLRMAEIRSVVTGWAAEPSQEDPIVRRRAGLRAFESPWAEDKLAGILVLERDADDLDRLDLEAIADLFRRELVADRNTTDWLCVKVLDRVVRGHAELADHIAGWAVAEGEPLWLRRAGLVAFVNVAPTWAVRPGPPLDRILGAADALSRSPERFHQTAVGWCLREVSRGDAAAAVAFIRQRLDRLSSEAVRQATGALPPGERSAVRAEARHRRRAAASRRWYTPSDLAGPERDSPVPQRLPDTSPAVTDDTADVTTMVANRGTPWRRSVPSRRRSRPAGR
jgi:3-methyladenine DNA glycosylase AlkD